MITLHVDDDRVAVDPQDGARLTSLVAGGRERLVTDPGPGSEAMFSRGVFIMAPWVGRIADGLLRWAGTEHLLPRRGDGNALHGLVDDRPWEVVTHTDDHVRLEHRIKDPAGPWTGCVVTHDVALGAGRLDLRLELTADGRPVPVALGWHPCFQRPTDGDVSVAVASDATLVLDDHQLPTGRLRDVVGDTDLRSDALLGERRLDDVWVDVHAPVHIAWPDLDLLMSTSQEVATIVVFTPPTHFCVEPQTAWPDAVRLESLGLDNGRLETGLATVAPGETTSATTTWTWSPR